MTPVEPESVVFGATDEMANAYKDERGVLLVYWNGVERDEINVAATTKMKRP
ncbi:hypothetical protein PC129_g5686 [Phytophthora cactorum]|uniref:Uncharacterized protein n=1 Tax=Phytophthora cactorum TaxID=29920 RepID=A0A8T0Y2Y9_9STRA|nr:hypothetical protein Pcac1_g5713 [Phytophthora cactorum]KAG2796006.1 hypothetical protein PC111_g21912 [Phytophthora cactorum]KAG2796523.1 hypothetical protein PC112_g22168 [Phytophthora cactorum]KAG2832996.1 hypothetical protein PC113_g20649 [Phytophthora cactorum]KAG3223666.1 hypothetical protein PC129_g5686 [Phytophthora cactorum]